MSFQTGISFFLMLNTKEDILKNAGNKTVDGQVRCSVSAAPHGYVFYVYLRFDLNENSVSVWCSWHRTAYLTINCFITSILQNIFFCVQHKKKLIPVWNDMKIHFFGLTIPLTHLFFSLSWGGTSDLIFNYNNYCSFNTFKLWFQTTRIPEMLGRFLNLNKMKTKRLSNHMSQYFIHNWI